MVIKSLELSDFRNYAHTSVTFVPGINCLIGDNGQGKTNLIESIYFATHLKSFRTSRLRDLCSFERPSATIQLSLSKRSVTHDVRITVGDNVKKVLLDHDRIHYFSEYIRNFYSLLFAPDLLTSFKVFPLHRRNFIDRVLFLIDPDYFRNVKEYNRIKKQKGYLLKLKEKKQISVWNKLLAAIIPKMVQAREELTRKINDRLSDIFLALTGRGQKLKLSYQHNFDRKNDISEFNILSFLTSKIDVEIEKGKICYGPHRDNFFMTLDNRGDRQSFSQGEYRISFLSLQLAINEIITQRLDFNPIILLDDITSELDDKVISKTVDYISQKQNQVFITSVKPLDSFPYGAVQRITGGAIHTT